MGMGVDRQLSVYNTHLLSCKLPEKRGYIFSY